jgi:hypothetical protein
MIRYKGNIEKESLRHRLGILFLVSIMIVSLIRCGGGAAPLTIAASGITVSSLLDKLDDRISHIIGQAAAAGSLVSSKAARDLQLQIEAARQQLHDEMDHNWDRLGKEKISVLREIDSSISRVEKLVAVGGRMHDDLTLDVSDALNRFPFLKQVWSIRRIEGSSQYYRDDGSYRIVVRSNVVDLSTNKPEIVIGKIKIRPEWIVLHPPHDMSITIPAGEANKYFQESTLAEIPAVIKSVVPNRSSGFEFWKPATRTASFKFTLELFPKYPASYRLTEYSEEKIIDETKKLIQKGQFVTVPGCGNSG